MEINNQPIQGPRPNRRSANEQPIDITRLNREAIQRSTDEFEESQYSTTDRIDLSAEGQALAAGAAKGSDKADEARRAEAAHRAKVQDLKQKYVEGKLNTHERVERAAQKLLTPD